jgi:hypothetical protein
MLKGAGVDKVWLVYAECRNRGRTRLRERLAVDGNPDRDGGVHADGPMRGHWR